MVFCFCASDQRDFFSTSHKLPAKHFPETLPETPTEMQPATPLR